MPSREPAKPRVARTRNDGTMTEAQYRGWIRSNLRRMSMRWRPIYGVLNDFKRAATAEDRRKYGNRIKYTHQCSMCSEWFPKKMIEVDHIIPCGSLADIETDAGPFIVRMLVERDGLRLLCSPCHAKVTKNEKDISNS